MIRDGHLRQLLRQRPLGLDYERLASSVEVHGWRTTVLERNTLAECAQATALATTTVREVAHLMEVEAAAQSDEFARALRWGSGAAYGRWRCPGHTGRRPTPYATPERRTV